jgi:ribosome-associated heat shock protein Hsp15
LQGTQFTARRYEATAIIFSISFERRAPMTDSLDALRIDRWLYYCRFYKSRSLATAAVSGGHVRINGERTTPGARVKCGDRIELVRDRLPYVMDVTAIPARRGPATEARRCYEEDQGIVLERESLTRALRQDRLLMPKTKGRPDKHTRRQLIKRNRS